MDWRTVVCYNVWSLKEAGKTIQESNRLGADAQPTLCSVGGFLPLTPDKNDGLRKVANRYSVITEEC